MRNLCQICCEKTRKMCALVLILCLIWGLAPAAEGISVKLRGKIALAGILSGLTYLTHALVTRDRRAVEKLRLHLGPPERVVQFEQGFDIWRIDHYEEQCYMFRNNLFISSLPCVDLQSEHQVHIRVETCTCKFMPPFLIDTPVLVSPRSLRLCPLHLRRAPQFVSSGLYRLADGRLLDLERLLSR